MTRKSRLELLFEEHMREVCAELDIEEPEREYHFHPTRLWRFDFAFPARKIAVAIEGAVWTRGRHNRGAGFIADCEKYNEAERLGWHVYRMPGPWVEGGRAARLIRRVLCESGSST